MNDIPSADKSPVAMMSGPKTQSLASSIATRPTLPGTRIASSFLILGLVIVADGEWATEGG